MPVSAIIQGVVDGSNYAEFCGENLGVSVLTCVLSVCRALFKCISWQMCGDL